MISFKEYLKEKEEAPTGVCWKGHKMVGFKRKKGKKVPNCVPVQEGKSIHDPVRPGILKRQIKGKLTCAKARALKAKQKNKGNNTAKGAQRYLNYHC